MKVLFITDDFIIDPLGISWLSSYLKEEGFEVNLIKTTGNWLDKVIGYNPQLLCFSVTSANFRKYISINNQVKEHINTFSLFGGPHCTFFPDWYKEEPNVDAICRGEGWEAIVDVAECIRDGNSIDDILNINNNPLRPLIDKHDILLPDRELIYKYKVNYNNPIKNVMCSFGCYGKCSYCYASRWRNMYNLNGIELRPVEEIIREIEQLLNYPLKLIYFQDDIFPLYNKQWINRFIELYSDISIPFHIQTRIELVNKDLVQQLKDVGLHGVTYAVESADEDFRQEVLNRKVNNETIFKNNQILKDAGIHTRVENMLGAPDETYKQALDTLKMNIKLKPDIGWASIFQSYPGTVLGDKYFDNNDILPEDFFTSQNNGHYRISNLQKLFAIGSHFPKLVPVIRLASYLPPNRLFLFVYNITKRLLYDRKLFYI